MITNDAGLELVREQLQRAERILEANKRDFGHNPVQYDLFSANVMDMIDEMRADIDAYLGTTTPREGAAFASELEPAG